MKLWDDNKLSIPKIPLGWKLLALAQVLLYLSIVSFGVWVVVKLMQHFGVI